MASQGTLETLRKSSLLKRLIIVLVLLFLVLILLLAGIFWWLLSPTSTGPTWHNLTVGRSTAADVISQLGTPSRIDKTIGTETYYYQGGAFTWAAHQITIRGGIVEQIKEDMFVYDPREVYLSEFVDRYGRPDKVLWSMRGHSTQVLIFLHRGILLESSADPRHSQLILALYYRPCSMICVQAKFGSMFATRDPYPDSDVYAPLDPWGFTTTP